jgi:hypothetical protein
MKSITLYSGGSTVRHWGNVDNIDIYASHISFDHSGVRYTVAGDWILEEK